MKLILVRHGQTKENKNKIWQGQSEGTLSEEGEEQARKLAKKLEKESIDVIYCSDLQRTKNTIKPFLEKNNLPIKYVEALRERKLGVLEGSTTEQVGKYLAENKIDFKTCNFETGETFYEMRERLAKFYESIAEKHKNDTVLLVTHGGFVSQLILHLFGYPPDRFSGFIPDNAGVTEIEIKKGKPKLASFNNTNHL